MNYVVYRFRCTPPHPLGDLLAAELADIGFDSFVPTADGMEAYVPETLDNPDAVQAIADALTYLGTAAWNRDVIPHQNWNAQWEADYPMVWVDDRCVVRAPFHPQPRAGVLDLLIAPQMSFGTGHHATTRMALALLLELPLLGRRVLDMGTGTGVLAIASAKCGAAQVLAIDIDEWSVQNAIQNAALNHVQFPVEKGDVDRIYGMVFDVIIANINKNVLLQHLPAYATCLAPGGVLLLSGFFDADVPALLQAGTPLGFRQIDTRTDAHWAALKWIKEQA
jgi:ribosomal protein L11 methyltransferase